MILRLFSDIHLEFYGTLTAGIPHVYEPLPSDPESILIMAGDIGVAKKAHNIHAFVKMIAPRFRHIIYVMGNHEHYGYSYARSEHTIKEALATIPNVTLLQREAITIDDITFIGATLWTDFDRNSPVQMQLVPMYMTDYKVIRNGPATDPYFRKLNSTDIYNDHQKDKQFIIEQLASPGRYVVISHHLPSFKSVHPMFHGSNQNFAYYSDLDDVIYNSQPELWLHGHTHCNADYMLDNTRVVCNPRGYYPEHINPEYNDRLTIYLD